MSNIAIRVENLSKLPRLTGYIGRARQRHDTLRDTLGDFLPRISRMNTKNNEKFVLIRGKKNPTTPSGRSKTTPLKSSVKCIWNWRFYGEEKSTDQALE